MFVEKGSVNCVSLSFCHHCSCTPAQIVRTLSNADIFSKRVTDGMESKHSFNLVAEPKLQELETEQHLTKDLFIRA